MCVFFFFSSRRRHTRYWRDWSSDVCSSDLLANFLLVRFLFPGPEAPVEVPYTFFKEEVRAQNVEAIYSQGDTVEGRFEEPVTYPPKGEAGSEPDSVTPRTSETFTTVLPSFVDPGLEELLIDNGVEISAEPIQEGGKIGRAHV